MREIILIGPETYQISTIQNALPKGTSSVISEAEGRLVVRIEGSDDMVEFVQDNSVNEYYDEPEEREILSIVGSSSRFYVVHFKNIEQLKTMLISVADRSDVVIDNDFGLIESGDKFVVRCKDSPGWDWLKV